MGPGDESVSVTAGRFWRKVEKTAPSGCWYWQGATNRGGYGVFGDGVRTRLAHRYAWEMEHARSHAGLR